MPSFLIDWFATIGMRWRNSFEHPVTLALNMRMHWLVRYWLVAWIYTPCVLFILFLDDLGCWVIMFCWLVVARSDTHYWQKITAKPFSFFFVLARKRAQPSVSKIALKLCVFSKPMKGGGSSAQRPLVIHRWWNPVKNHVNCIFLVGNTTIILSRDQISNPQWWIGKNQCDDAHQQCFAITMMTLRHDQRRSVPCHALYANKFSTASCSFI